MNLCTIVAVAVAVAVAVVARVSVGLPKTSTKFIFFAVHTFANFIIVDVDIKNINHILVMVMGMVGIVLPTDV